MGSDPIDSQKPSEISDWVNQSSLTPLIPFSTEPHSRPDPAA